MDDEERYASGSGAESCGLCGRINYTQKHWDIDHILPKAFFPDKEFLKENQCILCPDQHLDKSRPENWIRDLYVLGVISLEERQQLFKKNAARLYGVRVWEI